MNQISFVIAPFEYGVGLADGVEPVVDGVSVVDFFRRADGRRTSYASLREIDAHLRSWAPTDDEHGIRLLGCGCGDSDCTYVRARLIADTETVVWTGFWASSPPTDRPEGHEYPEIGPFRFDRRAYEAALANPLRATDSPGHSQDSQSFRSRLNSP
jgi:hypothetical protein